MKEQSLLCTTTASSTLTRTPAEAADGHVLWAPTVAGLHHLAYVEWGRSDAEHTVVCVHGLARNGRDFDTLARHLSATYRVVCPDMPGRGRSSWLTLDSGDGGYNISQYLVDVTALIARLDVPQIDWIGTSMGALIGMFLAVQPGSPIRRLVINDTAPVVPAAFQEYLASYITADPDFATTEELEQYLRRTYAGFGALSDDQWQHLARFGGRRKPSGAIGLAYDPAIGKNLVPPFADVDLRGVWSAITCPVLVLRGEHSPLVTAELADEMAAAGPHVTVATIPGCGHAPSLTTPAQIGLVDTWLATGQVH